MARSFSNVKVVISTFFAKEISPSVVARRAYAAAASQSKTVSSGASNAISQKGAEESVKVSWVPDPVTGYYRPENGANEADPADLRAMLIKNKTTRN